MQEQKYKMKVGILGLGEVGKAIKEVYENANPVNDYEMFFCDKGQNLYEFKKPIDVEEQMEYIHICIPYSDKFEGIVEGVIETYKPIYTIIHSTVKVGTTKRLNDKFGNIVHSPIRGVHPNLYKGVMTFLKYIGADDTRVGITVLRHFVDDLYLQAGLVERSGTTELGKLLSTTYYGMAIAFHDYADNLCKENDLNFGKVMTSFNHSYNAGYTALGMREVVRPNLYPPKGKIGGHCIVPNAKILKEQFGDSEVLKMILDLQ